ncbi:hypothetical protein HanRHA438_Chr17g0798301 [Helianthus annuus]|uniref:Uncharacterized protein n=1 Tax=Helianthus annuus TaxID=4232 RepID=A0A251RRI0_HELAN|nr:hypothetical protein HanHA300_Chr17g0642331 [Helianthus annuus]KAJ0446400.1 hypothetical protein HanHA89_Chr17g0693901 [Helianthus annuus]KAJ0635225.1 hypothetical protein HanOQP8_Chr17g0648501 [Helianthus annuus]KAJ0824986.1 hypothetical protein HanRHA438_Chr17g0798301 [Helianthus annuus]
MSDHSTTQIQQEPKQETPQIKTPLLPINQNQTQNLNPQIQEQEQATHLHKTLKRLELYLILLGFDQSSVLRFGVSWITFLVIGVAFPVVIILLTTNCSTCGLYEIKGFELVIVVSHACLAAVALLCVSYNLRKYGVRKFLFVDQYSGYVERFSKEYVQKISESIRLFVLWVLPCITLKIALESIRIIYMHQESWWKSFGILAALTFSWVYVNFIYLSSCIVFHLVCSLQIIHFDDYGRLLETETDVLVFIEEHARLRHDLSKISHRFRIYLLLVFAIVTSSQFAMLFEITEFSNEVTFMNGGDFAVSSIAQVLGLTLCLNAAAKISHRAQGVAGIATRWHALASCGPDDTSHMRLSNRLINDTSSESDLEAMNYTPLPTNTQLTSYLSSYHRRQAFVIYLQNNPGGITLYGWTVDRSLINTIFFIELSLVLFVLGRTTVFTYESLP